MDLIPDFIKRRHGEVKIEYPHPLLEPISKETYGVLIYQEQVMQATQVLAGYTLGGADLLRRAMGKKKLEEMAKQRKTFVEGAARVNNIPAPKANEIFDLLEKFAGYGFNKSHAAAYAIVSYQTAYLKANYPVEFYSANMTNEMSNTEKLGVLIEEGKQYGIETLGPDVNESFVQFAPASRGENKEVIRFGLAAIKGVGEIAVQSILDARKEAGKFKSLEDMCERVDGRTVNRKVLEALIKSGACDCFGETRSTLFAKIDRVLTRAAGIIADRQRGQNTLFGMFEEQKAEQKQAEPDRQLPEWPQNELLAHEKELLGFYVSGHPLTPFSSLIERYGVHKTSELSALPGRSMTRIAGLISAVQQGISKKSGKPYAMVTLEDLQGTIQILCMNENFDKFRHLFEANKAVLVIGEVNNAEDKAKIFPQEIMLLEDAPKKYTKQVYFRLNTSDLTPETFQRLRGYTDGSPGKIPVFLALKRPGGETVYIETHEKYSITPSYQLQQTIEETFGAGTYYAKVDTSLPEPQKRRWETKSNNNGGGGDD